MHLGPLSRNQKNRIMAGQNHSDRTAERKTTNGLSAENRNQPERRVKNMGSERSDVPQKRQRSGKIDNREILQICEKTTGEVICAA